MKKCATLFILLLSTTTTAAPTTFQFSGILQQNSSPADGPVELTISIFSDAEPGTPIYSQVESTVATDGFIAVDVGAAGDLDSAVLASDETLWMELAVDGQELPNRFPLPSSAFAARAENAASLTGLSREDLETMMDALSAQIADMQAQMQTAQAQATALDFSTLPNVPADFQDGDDVSLYTPGSGITLNATAVSIGPGQVQAEHLANASVSASNLDGTPVYAYPNFRSSKLVGPNAPALLGSVCSGVLGSGQFATHFDSHLGCDGSCRVTEPGTCAPRKIGLMVKP